ncbi:MAG: 30S ribosomal protein S17e [archaeon]|nr:30S ribosomal protein S17e [archaeon]
MGRIKSALIKRTAKALLKEENKFNKEFNNNKKILGRSMPSIRLRNQIAGYITRINTDKQKKKTPPKEIQEIQ